MNYLSINSTNGSSLTQEIQYVKTFAVPDCGVLAIIQALGNCKSND